jgi:hypothetical protein
VCFAIVTPNPLPSDYNYPAPHQGNVNYRAPLRYLDLEAIDSTAAVAPNFTLDELAQVWKGRYAEAVRIEVVIGARIRLRAE